MIMSILRFFMVILICLPIGYLLLYLNFKLRENLTKTTEFKRNYNDEKRSVYNDRGSRRGR